MIIKSTLVICAVTLTSLEIALAETTAPDDRVAAGISLHFNQSDTVCFNDVYRSDIVVFSPNMMVISHDPRSVRARELFARDGDLRIILSNMVGMPFLERTGPFHIELSCRVEGDHMRCWREGYTKFGEFDVYDASIDQISMIQLLESRSSELDAAAPENDSAARNDMELRLEQMERGECQEILDAANDYLGERLD